MDGADFDRQGAKGGSEPDGALPDDPDEQRVPVAVAEPAGQSGVRVLAKADNQSWVGDVWTGTGSVEFHYRDYVLRADKVVYDRSTSEVTAEGNLEVAGGPEDVLIRADHGDMRLSQHTGRFYQVSGSEGVRNTGRSRVYSTANPFLFSGRVLIEAGEGHYRIVDGSMTNCRLPRPDWRLLARSIEVDKGEASMRNSIFQFQGVPLFYLPYLRHPAEETGRESGLLIPVLSNSTIKGLIVGEQYYWVINRSMDMIMGSEYYSKRGWAPNGDFRYKGPGLDHLIVRWNALLDRGVEEAISPSVTTAPGGSESKGAGGAAVGSEAMQLVNQGGVDLVAIGRKDFTSETRLAGNVDFLSSYIYRLVFNDNYSQAISSQVSSVVSLTHEHGGLIPSLSLERFQTFASSTEGDEARILHTPNLRYDVVDRPLLTSGFYWGLGSSLDYLSRSEPQFHARNIGRLDFYPHLSFPLSADGWRIVPEVAVRETFYTGGQNPDLTGARNGTPTISHNALNRSDIEASLDVRPPAVERDFELKGWNRELRHVIEPELSYRFVAGIGSQQRNVLLADTTDIATDTNELGVSLTQRFYLRSNGGDKGTVECTTEAAEGGDACAPKAREWADWQVAGKFFFDLDFGGALIAGRRNVFDSTLDLTGISFLSEARNFSPLISRLRFEAIENLRVEWDLDYDPKTNRLDSDNVFAGYSWGNATLGLGHAHLNALDENAGSASTIKSQQVQPFLSIGKQSSGGLNFAANAGYDFVQHTLQYTGVQAVYNWNCCGLTFGYRRFELGSVRDETQYLYSFTLANFGSVGDIRRSNSVFRDPNLPPAY